MGDHDARLSATHARARQCAGLCRLPLVPVPREHGLGFGDIRINAEVACEARAQRSPCESSLLSWSMRQSQTTVVRQLRSLDDNDSASNAAIGLKGLSLLAPNGAADRGGGLVDLRTCQNKLQGTTQLTRVMSRLDSCVWSFLVVMLPSTPMSVQIPAQSLEKP